MQEKVPINFFLNWKHFLAILSSSVKIRVECVSDGAAAMAGKKFGRCAKVKIKLRERILSLVSTLFLK
jgi:dolichol kinase